MLNVGDRTKKMLEDMEKIDGKNIEFLTVAMAIRDFDSETRTEWLKQLSSVDELPTLEKFLEFVTPLSRNLPRTCHFFWRKTTTGDSQQRRD